MSLTKLRIFPYQENEGAGVRHPRAWLVAPPVCRYTVASALILGQETIIIFVIIFIVIVIVNIIINIIYFWNFI